MQSSYDAKVAELYDRLLGFEGQADGKLTVHKKLRFPAAWRARGIADINDWLKRELAISAETHLLDAGCGVGGTLFDLLADGGSGVGITLSSSQVDTARNAAVRLGVQDRIHFHQQSYDEPLDAQFDLIITVEALAHSADLTRSIDNLSKALKPNGRLVLVEEMLVDAVSPQNKLRDLLQKAWGLARVYREVDYREGVVSAELTPLAQHNFTPYVHAKRWPTRLLTAANYLINVLPPKQQHLLQIYVGGLALESLYATNQMHYQVWVLEK
ncbi:MAG: SAM-dependent methyltransferase [Candidatus Promineifilaceae bacterium]